MQPTYLPWMGYFDLIDQSDYFVFLDDVQLQRSSWQVRNKIKTSQGELLLTVPIKKNKPSFDLMINEAVVNDFERWRSNHLKSIKHAYSTSSFFKDVYCFLDDSINLNTTFLYKININIIKLVCRKIGIKTVFIKSSDLKISKDKKKDKKLVAICKKISAENYLSAKSSASYIEDKNPGGQFSKNKINLFYHNFKHPDYKQLYGEFVSHLSIIDLLFNCGLDKSLEIIRKGRREPQSFLDLKI